MAFRQINYFKPYQGVKKSSAVSLYSNRKSSRNSLPMTQSVDCARVLFFGLEKTLDRNDHSRNCLVITEMYNIHSKGSEEFWSLEENALIPWPKRRRIQQKPQFVFRSALPVIQIKSPCVLLLLEENRATILRRQFLLFSKYKEEVSYKTKSTIKVRIK